RRRHTRGLSDWSQTCALPICARRCGTRACVNVVLAALVVVASLLPGSEPAAATAVDWRDQAIYMVMTDRFRNGDPENDLDSVPEIGRASCRERVEPSRLRALW